MSTATISITVTEVIEPDLHPDLSPHEFVDDGSGESCTKCPMKPIHPVHGSRAEDVRTTHYTLNWGSS